VHGVGIGRNAGIECHYPARAASAASALERITKSHRGSSVLKENILIEIARISRAKDSVFPKERWTTDSARQAEAIYVEVVLYCVKVAMGVVRDNLKLDTHGILVCAEIGVRNAGKCGTAKVRVSSSTEAKRRG